MKEIMTDVIVTGAGPAGATLALMLAGSGISVTITDKATFPRDKTCGDALSGKVVSILKRLPGETWTEFLSTVPVTPSHGIRFVSPGLHETTFRFSHDADEAAKGYIAPRREFDAFLVSKLRNCGNITLLEGEKSVAIEKSPGGITLETANYRVKGRVIAGADGVNSFVRSGLYSDHPVATACTGLRAYYEGVTGCSREGYIELFFFRELLPFYFWIFPETGGNCNVGLAMMRRDISEQRVSLGAILDRIVTSHPLVAPRFTTARLVGKPAADALPLGIPPGPFSSERSLLLGDAASLVEPFTGEGIGNAMASGEVAARVIRMCLEKNDLSARSLKTYDRKLMRRLGNDFRASALLHRLARHPHLFDLIVKGTKKNKAFHRLISTFFLR